MRRADEATIAAGTSAEVLMERAGRAVARVVVREAGGRYGKRIAVVCGKGNNGGDGFVVARVLHHQGLGVICSLAFDADEAKGPAKYHLDRLRVSGCPIAPFAERHLEADVIVDAVFGTGFSGEPMGTARDAIAGITHAVQGEEIVHDAEETYAAPAVWPIPRVVSIDVPSAGWVPADVVVALGAEKFQTFFEADDPARVEVADIGIQIEEANVAVLEEADVAMELRRPSLGDHKTSRGSVLIVAGSNTTTGAPILTARGAARFGSGYVTLLSTDRVVDAAESLIPEVLKRRSRGDVLGPQLFDEIGDLLERVDSIALGPGLGIGDAQRQLVVRLLDEWEGPVVLDADGLNNLVGHTDALTGRGWPVVITPHVAEMARLLDRPTPDVNRNRLRAAVEAAERFGCVVILKGYRTIVAATSAVTPGVSPPSVQSDLEPGDVSAITIPVGGPELATAGTGDVLTGALAAQVAGGGHPLFGAAAACYVHGVAGSVVAGRSGASGVVAWDVAEALPEVVERIRGPYAV